MSYENYVLDARPDRLDLRDREYRPHLQSLPAELPSAHQINQFLPCYEQNKLILDQGQEGACTGFGLAATINYLIWRDHIQGSQSAHEIEACSIGVANLKVSERMLYHMARIYDEWPGEDYSGSSCRGAMKGWHRHGVCRAETWPYDPSGRFLPPKQGWEKEALETTLGAYYRIDKNSVEDMQAAIFEVGAIYCSAKVHEGWYVDPASQLPVIEELDKIVGGHAFCIIGYNREGFIVQNSWGSGWGYKGFALLTYADWVRNGRDAWVISRGVPIAMASIPTMLATDSLNEYSLSYQTKSAVDRDRKRRKVKTNSYEYPETSKTKPWSRDYALKHALIIENNGRPRHTYLAAQDCEASAHYICHDHLRAWLEERPTNRKILIYAHGGLTSEDAAIRKIEVMGPCFYANEIYPIFAVWKTGLYETLCNIIKELAADIFGKDKEHKASGWIDDIIEKLTDTTDSGIEALARGIKARGIWSEMKENAVMASDSSIYGLSDRASGEKGAMVLLAQALQTLVDDFPDLEIHIVGHSAGTILLGAWLDKVKTRKLSIESAHLYAPACTIKFANNTFKKSVVAGVLPLEGIFIHNMDDERERADTTSPLYRKSLLYLVSRGLESAHKMPILGLQAAWDATKYHPKKSSGFNFGQKKEAEEWADFIKQGNETNVYTAEQSQVLTSRKPNRYIPLAHGSFDNDIEVIEATIEIIRGDRLLVPLHNLAT